MNRHDLFLKWLSYALATFLLAILQTLLFNRLCLLHTHPFVLPIMAAMAVIMEPIYEGFSYAMALGFLCDLTISGAFPCFYTVSFLLLAILCTWIARKLIVPGFWCAMVCGTLSIAVCDLIYTMAFHYQHATPYYDALRLMGREIFLSVPLIPLVYLLFHQINLRSRRD